MTKSTKMKALGALLAFGVLGSAGCFSRVHMSKNYGRAYRQAFERQAVNPAGGATAKTPKGLDAVEAVAVVNTYRAGLVQQGGSSPGNQMILLSPNAGPPLGYAAPPASPPAK